MRKRHWIAIVAGLVVAAGTAVGCGDDSKAADATQPTNPSAQDARIVFTSERDGNPEIYVVNADGSGLRAAHEHAERGSRAGTVAGRKVDPLRKQPGRELRALHDGDRRPGGDEADEGCR